MKMKFGLLNNSQFLDLFRALWLEMLQKYRINLRNSFFYQKQNCAIGSNKSLFMNKR